MECIDVKTYVCKLCGYITNSKPSSFPICPACEIGETKYTSTTKED
jgi:rubrerythrin